MSVQVKTINGYKVVTETGIALADSDGANVVNAYTTTINDPLGGVEAIPVQVEVTSASSGDGGLDLAIQGSLDGENWVDLDASVGLDVDTSGTNTGVATAVLTSLYSPYFRIKAFTDGTDTEGASTLTISYAFKPE